MTKKIFKSILFASLVTLLASFVVILGITYKHFTLQLLDQLSEEAAYAAKGYELSGYEYFDSLDAATRLTLIASDGAVIYDSEASDTLGNHAEREEFREAMANGTGSAVRLSESFSVTTLYYAIRLDDGSVLRISSVQPTAFSVISLLLTPLIFLTLLIVVFSVIYAVRMSQKIIKPINELDLEAPDEAKCYEELSPLIQRIRRQNSFIDRQSSELRSKRDEFMAITENMSEGFLLVDNQRGIVSYNSSALRILGLDRESGVLSDGSSLAQVLDSALSGNRSECDFSLAGADYRVIASPVLSRGEVNGAVAIILDVTEKSRREAIRREFTSNVSHELKTPLTSINAASEMLAGGMVKAEDISRFSTMIHNESSRLIVLVNDIIRLSQLDENFFPEERENIDLFEMSAGVIDSLRAAADAKEVTFTLNGSGSVEGLPSIIEEMIYNLCDNAVKYNKQGGSVAVSIAESGDKVAFTVEDTGIGIPNEFIGRVFERFYRVDKSRSKEIGGTGLGLSIVRHAANTHNAEINMSSRLGIGTKIVVTFKKPQAS